MLVHLDPLTAVLVSSAVWAVLGVVTGYTVHRMPVARLDHDTWLTRPRAFESDGRWYERRLHIARWKDRVPEWGALFPDGTSKRRLPGRTDADLARFAVETRRAETVHWANLAAGPAFLLWCPPALGVIMVAFGVGAHAPFICIQRYNRARIERTLRRRRHRAT
ncbi:MAG: hypothetical protein ACKO04_09120 [Actinomycetes bacterium]